jgi:hypothetical protein
LEDDLQCSLGFKFQLEYWLSIIRSKPLVKIRKKRSESVGSEKMSYLILRDSFEPGDICDMALK